MKKICFFIICLLMFIPVINAEELMGNSKSVILMENQTGKILYEKNSHERFAPASMTKIMGMILVLEKIEDGTIKWSDVLTTSENASKMGGSQIFLQAGEKMSVHDLFEAVAVASANDAMMVLAENTYGSKEKFINKMNEKVKEMGLKDTNFKNVVGLDEANHFSSAYDMAIMARELIKHEVVFKYTTIYEDYLRKDTENKFWLVNTNKLIRTYDGADGLKTGYTKEAGYCLTATAKRNNMRLIGVVMGSNTNVERNDTMKNLLNYGFNSYKMQIEFKKGTKITSKKIYKAKEEKVNIVTKEDSGILVEKSEAKKDLNYEIKLKDIKIPVKKGSKVGVLYLKDGSKVISKTDLTVDKSVYKASFLANFKRTILKILSGNI